MNDIRLGQASKKLIHDQSGMMYILVIVFILAIGIFSVIGYSASMLNSVYQQAERTLERSGNISVIETKIHANVRDTYFDLDNANVSNAFKQNLLNQGLLQNESFNWQYFSEGRLVYEFDGMALSISGDVLQINTDLKVPLIWNLGTGPTTQTIPIQVRSRILYYIP